MFSHVPRLMIVVLSAALLVVLALVMDGSSPDDTAQAGEAALKPEISLSAHGLAVKCDSQPSINKGDVPKPLKCDVPLGGTFNVSIEINTAPAAGYVTWVTELDYGALGALIYKKAPAATDEIVVPCFGTNRLQPPSKSTVVHVCDNLAKTHTLGNIVELEFNCTATKSSNVIDLISQPGVVVGTVFAEAGTGDLIDPNLDALGINCVNPPQDGQINIIVVNADNQTQKLADTCWLISVNHFDGMSFVNKPFDIVSDNNAKPAICDALGPIKGDLSDKDPAVGSIAVTIPAAEIEFWDSIEWHFQQVQAPDNYNVDTNKWVCTLSGLNKKSPPNEDLIACDEANPFVVKNVAKSPPNDDFLTRTVVGGLPYSDAVVTKAATTGGNDPAISCKSAYGHSVWYQYTPTVDQLVTVDTFGSDYNTVLAAFSGPNGALNEIGCNDDSGGQQSKVFANLTGGITYHFLVGSWETTPGGKLVFNMEAKASPPSSCNEGNNDDFELGIVDFNQIFCWTVVDQNGAGSWCTQTGTSAPIGDCIGPPDAVPAPPQGGQAAMTNQCCADTLVLYRCNVLASGSVSFQLYINNQNGTFISPATLKIAGGEANQQFRADLVTKAGMEADPFTVDAGDVLQTIYQTDPGDPAISGYTPVVADVSAFIGQNVCLRFAVAVNQNFFHVGIDDVQFELKKKKPGDTDGDGCPDVHENRPKDQANQGGGRNYLDPNDYYDVLGPGGSLTLDGVIDLPNDILGVILRFAPLGTEPTYDVRFDRGVTIGANHWQRAGPDGVIDLPNDILGVIFQFNHNCV